ncbi:centrosomal protein of 170 kDa isoform X3 [Protopterus annectens]|uniref:centrosomal protein of 170 kDa isoform X3 n=1 Tax=Protopterus annectens TaxID=7888 RepID=UPI001CFC289C|nr:centrosomal protein of 170 kDa isoform X3 [Protopterus annectens]
MSLTAWFLVSSGGTRHRLPREMIFVGRDDCELMLQSRSVDKQHAVINYDSSMDEHLVKDLGSLNGTFVNDVRIPDQVYMTLKQEDKLRFGYDTNLFTVVRGELRVPEEALKHEKFTSQLHMSQKSTEPEVPKLAGCKNVDTKALEDFKHEASPKVSDGAKCEDKTAEIPGLHQAPENTLLQHSITAELSAMPRGTPLYGQPSWWGEDDADDENSSKQEAKPSTKKQDGSASGSTKETKKSEEEQKPEKETAFSFCREPSYFEIPTKEFQQPSEMEEGDIHEAPTKDMTSSHAASAGHASFTIEFDDHAPGKVTIKDHVTKFTSEHRHKSKRPSSCSTKELSGLQAAMIAAESKVADWLAQNDPPRMRRESREEDSKSIKSDVPVYLKRLKGSKHEDGTQSDSENGAVFRHSSKHATMEEHLRVHHSERKHVHQRSHTQEKPLELPALSRTAFMIEFFDGDSTRKRRSYSFTQNAAALPQDGTCPVPPPTRPERPKPTGSDPKVGPTSSHSASNVKVTQHSKHVLKQKCEEASSQNGLLKNSGSCGSGLRHTQEMEKQVNVTISLDKENEDDQSDKGTYTIELENSNLEEEEARRMIDKVFGVEESQDHSRPIIREAQRDLEEGCRTSSILLDSTNTQLDAPGFANVEINQNGCCPSSSPRWVSQWASLAANHIGHDFTDLRSDSQAFATEEKEADISESGISGKSAASGTSATSQGERKRRTLPQLPTEDKTGEVSRAKVSPRHRSEIGEKQDTELQEKETATHSSPRAKREQEAKSTSKVHRPVDGFSHKADRELLLPDIGKNDTIIGTAVVKQSTVNVKQHDQKWTSTKSSTASKQSTSAASQGDKGREDLVKKVPGVYHRAVDASDTRQSNGDVKDIPSEVKRKKTGETPRSQTSKGSDGERKETGRALVRQGSFTKDKPSANVPIELIPHISKESECTPTFSGTRLQEKIDSTETDSSLDTTLLLRDTEAVMAFLEAKLREENKLDDEPETPSYNRDDSLSPESDIDTASTISLIAGDTERKSLQKRRSLTSLYKERGVTSSPSKDQKKDHSKSTTGSAREKLEKKTKTRSTDLTGRSETRRSLQSAGKVRQPSLDLTDDDQTSSVPHSTVSDILSSDQETYSSRSQGRAPFTSTDELLHSKLEATKSTRNTASTALSPANKSVTLPRPRPTRTSTLRRARLGDASDSEVADADKLSVASEVSTTSSTTSKPPSGRKTPSRLDLLAQPRRTRLGSISARSDSEATVSRSSATSRNLDSAVRTGLRTASGTDSKLSSRTRANSISRMPDSKAKPVALIHSSPAEMLAVLQSRAQMDKGTFKGKEEMQSSLELKVNSRWRRFPTDYASTSEDEFGSNRSSPKHARLRSTAVLKNIRLQCAGAALPGTSPLKHKLKEQEEYIRDWTVHREEIARISQDLAIIAREINDVAGEIDSVTSSGTAPSTTVSTAATTPGSAIDTREELVDRVFDESLNFRKIPPTIHSKGLEVNHRPKEAPGQNAEPPEPQPLTRRRTWSRDEVMGDSLLLSSVFQFSRKIRHAVDKTAGKIRILFKDKGRNWEEVEKKLQPEIEVPIVKTSSMEISSILQELKRIEKQLQVINAMIDPDGTLEALSNLGLNSSSLITQPKMKSSASTQNSQPQVPAHSLIDSKAIRSAIVSVSSEFDSVESELDFSIHFNRFNPDGEEEDPSVNE